MRIITATARVALLVESILDRLFYDGYKRRVAKLLLSGDKDVKAGIAPQALRSEFPNEFSIARASSFRRLVMNIREILIDFMDDGDNINELAAMTGCTPEEAAATCQRLLK